MLISPHCALATIIYRLKIVGYRYTPKIYTWNDIIYQLRNNLSFADLLMSEMNQRGWSQSDLAREAGLGRAVINKITNHINKKPDPETCKAIARGLRMSPITVFIAAGLLPQMPERSTEMDDLGAIVERLSPNKRKELIVIARALLKSEENPQI